MFTFALPKFRKPFFENIEKEDWGKWLLILMRNKSWVILNFLYYEEFDPGSGWTLAAGLTHASRGAARVAILGGDRRTGE